jgi:hypothetical protein
MFSTREKQFIANEIEKILLSLNHPEMPKEKPNFKIRIDGKESWSWADIEPNWKYDGSPGNPWNEIAREVIKGK